jgi:hypothetical protein
MRKFFNVLGIGALLCGAVYITNVRATPASLFTGTTLALGRFGNIDVAHQALLGGPPARGHSLWLSTQKTKGASDVYVQSNLWQPGGTTGWHTHPGHSLIIVTAGTLTVYDGHDPSCAAHTYTAGMGFVDSGGDHTHVIRNEGTIEARSITVQTIPAGAVRRVDADAPAGCPL